VKVLKKHSSGLILYENFSSQLDTRIKINGVLDQLNKVLRNGELYFDIFNYEQFVFEVNNNYIPVNTTDIGGVFIRKDNNETIKFVEYYENTITPYPFVKIIRKNNEFIGKGSNDGVTWEDKGNVFFGPATQMGIFVQGSTTYSLNSISVYKDEYIYIYGVLDGWKLFVNDQYCATAQNSILKVTLPSYPFSGLLKIYAEDLLVCEYELVNVWGGDEYECTLDVQIIDYDTDTVLAKEENIHLGNLENGYILKKYFIKNNSSEAINCNVKIEEYSPFYDWVWLSYEAVDTISYENYEKQLGFSLEPWEQKEFYIFIKRPDTTISYDYRNKECVFFLSVE
jgi:hypothetical protein